MGSQAAEKIAKVIVGLGQTGYSCVRFFKQRGIPIAVTDSRESPPFKQQVQEEYPDVPLYLNGFNRELLCQAEEIIVSQGVSLQQPALTAAMKAGIPIVSDIEIFTRATDKPIVAITGSNGKSTVTTLLGEMANAVAVNAKVGGNLGPPALDLLLADNPDLYILEISNFQLETTFSLQARVACILNITPDHLDRYSDFSDYISAKQRIYRHCHTAVFNRDDKKTWIKTKRFISFGGEVPPADMFGLRTINQQCYFARGEALLMPVDNMKLASRMQWLNALAALSMAQALDWPLSPLLKVLETFSGLPHRCEHVRSRQGINWFNDSKGTNTGATCAALKSIGAMTLGKLIWIAGGDGKQADFSVLQPVVKKYVGEIILFGQDAEQIAQAVLMCAVPISFVKDLAEAIVTADQKAKQGDAILLSPACASFDMFSNFTERGNVFRHLVMELPE